MKRLICLVLFAITLLTVFPLSVLAGDNDTNKYLSETNIESDFLEVFGGAFNVEDYPQKDGESISVIAVMESKAAQSSKELYIYVYNPSRKIVTKQSDLNVVNIDYFADDKDSIVRLDTKGNYSLITLDFVSAYDDTTSNADYTNGLILKFKLNGAFESDETYKRHYSIAEIELLEKNCSLADAYGISNEYVFFNTGTGNYLNYYVNVIDTIDVNAYHTYYRVNTEGMYLYKDIQSVYFPVPNSYIEKFGGLVSMKCKWSVYDLNPALVTNNSNVNQVIKKNLIDYNGGKYTYEGESFEFKGNVNNGCCYSLFSSLSSTNMSLIMNFMAGYNMPALDKYIDEYYFDDYRDPVTNDYVHMWLYDFSDWYSMEYRVMNDNPNIRPLRFSFFSDSEIGALDGSALIADLDARNWSENLYVSFEDKEIEFLVNNTITDVTDFDLSVYEMCSGWEAFWSGYHENLSYTLEDFKTFQQIDVADLTTLDSAHFAEKYYMDSSDVQCSAGNCGKCLNCNVSKEKYSDCTWFLLRYDVTDYMASNALVIDNTNGELVECGAFISEVDVIRGFDTISVGFENTNDTETSVITVFGAVHSPTSFSPDLVNPAYKPKIDDSGDSWLDSIIDFISTVLMVAFIVIAVAVVLRIVVPLIPKRVKIKAENGKEKNKNDKK